MKYKTKRLLITYTIVFLLVFIIVLAFNLVGKSQENASSFLRYVMVEEIRR